MSTVDAQKFELIAASFNQTFSIFTAGATAIGDGILISNGVSQLNELDSYMYSTGKGKEGENKPDGLEDATETVERKALRSPKNWPRGLKKPWKKKSWQGN